MAIQIASTENPACLCGQAIAPQANYCSKCGRENLQVCPVCFEERRALSNLDLYASPWCAKRGELLVACSRCGRWLPAGVTVCPDPGCRGRVRETWPSNTGSAPDGAGRTDGWRWPAEWDRQNPAYRAPVYASWNAEGTVYAAFVAHGKLYVWVGSSLIAPGVGKDGAPSIGAAQSPSWKSWLGFDGVLSPTIGRGSAVALTGGGAILACAQDYKIVGLFPGRADEAMPLHLGAPVCQCAADGWWAGWVLREGHAELYAARISAQWRNTACVRVPTVSSFAAPRQGARMLMQGGVAFWVSDQGALWALNCEQNVCRQLSEPAADVLIGWCGADSNGAHLIRSGGDGIRVGLEPTGSDRVQREAPGGSGPIRDLFASKGLIAVVGEDVVTLDSRTGYILGGGRYTGQWIAGAVAETEADSPDREPRLLMLTQDGDAGNLTSLRPSSGGEEPVWRGSGTRPTGLIVAGRRLYIVCETGVVSIRPAASAPTAEEQ